MTLELSAVRLDVLVRETVADLQTQTRGDAVTLRTEIPRGLRALDTDVVRMKQVLINLIGNALKFTERGDVVVAIEADREGRPITLSVRDTGIGIPPDRLAAIFNAFEQADSMTARRFGGTGLGLAISRSFCELMGHDLVVQSVEGKGTRMIIHFVTPLDAPFEVSGAPSIDVERPQHSGGRKYAIV
jgi:signal transduction histidine kinase